MLCNLNVVHLFGCCQQVASLVGIKNEKNNCTMYVYIVPKYTNFWSQTFHITFCEFSSKVMLPYSSNKTFVLSNLHARYIWSQYKCWTTYTACFLRGRFECKMFFAWDILMEHVFTVKCFGIHYSFKVFFYLLIYSVSLQWSLDILMMSELKGYYFQYMPILSASKNLVFFFFKFSK